MLRGAGRGNNRSMLRRIVLLWGLVAGLNVFLRAQASSCGANQYDCAVFFVQHKQFPEAISTLTDLVRQSPGDLKALNLLGIAFTQTGQIENANAAFSQGLAVNAHFFPARKNLAINEFNRKRYGDAAAQFKEVLKDAPNDDVAELYLGEVNFQKKNFAAACTYYEKGRARVSLQKEWILHFGECLVKTKKLDEATAVLRKLPANDAQNRFDAGVFLGKAEAYGPAAEFFASARKRYSDPYTAGYNQVLMLLKADKSAEA